MLADYHLIRRHKLHLKDLYRGDSGSRYWFTHGFNWRGPVAFLLGVWSFIRTPLSPFPPPPPYSPAYNTDRNSGNGRLRKQPHHTRPCEVDQAL